MPPATDTAAPPGLALQADELVLVRDILRQHLPGVAVWAFGSRARGQAKPYSDLDLALIGSQPIPSAQLAALAEAFSESELRWKVDLVDWARTDPGFRAVIARDKVVLTEGG